MSMLIAAFMFIVLLALGTAHLVWSAGQTWPIRTEKLLAQTVVGTRNVEHMPPRPVSLGLAVLMLVAGVLALALADPAGGGMALTLAGLPLAAVFLARGIVSYLPWWVERTPEPSFRLNDRRVYSPLCLFLGFGFILLVLWRLL